MFPGIGGSYGGNFGCGISGLACLAMLRHLWADTASEPTWPEQAVRHFGTSFPSERGEAQGAIHGIDACGPIFAAQDRHGQSQCMATGASTEKRSFQTPRWLRVRCLVGGACSKVTQVCVWKCAPNNLDPLLWNKLYKFLSFDIVCSRCRCSAHTKHGHVPLPVWSSCSARSSGLPSRMPTALQIRTGD